MPKYKVAIYYIYVTEVESTNKQDAINQVRSSNIIPEETNLEVVEIE